MLGSFEATTMTLPWACSTSTGAPYSSLRLAEVSTSDGRAEPELTGREVEHLVDVVEHGVDVVRDEQHRGAVLAPTPVEQGGDLLLMTQIQRGQRLVTQQDRGIGRQRRGDPDPLQLAAGQHRDRGVTETVGADGRQQLVDPTAHGPSGAAGAERESPPVSVETHPHQVPGLEHGALVDRDPLRHVADSRTAAPYRLAADPRLAVGQLLLAEQHLEQARLPGPVRAQNRDELAGSDVEVQSLPQHPVAEGERGAAGPHGGNLRDSSLGACLLRGRHHPAGHGRTHRPSASASAEMFMSIQLR